MAWNEPGGNGGRDPWGGRGGQEGPPDLDELLKKLQERFGGIFGGGGARRGGGTSGPLGGYFLIAGLLFVAYLIWDVAYIIQPAERGVVLRFGKYATTMGPGFHLRLPRPIEKVEKVDVDSIRSVTHKAAMLTQDENIIDIEMAVQYKVGVVEDYLFRDRGPDNTLRLATESAVRSVIGRSKMDYVLTEGRSEIAAQIKELIQRLLSDYRTGLTVTSVNMQPAKPPEPVKAAFDDAIKAREDEQRLINEAEAYRNDILPKARGRAARMREEANAYKERVVADAQGETQRFLKLLTEYRKAPEVTRERLYIDTIESVLSRSSKVLLDSDSENIIYLPLERMSTSKSEAATALPHPALGTAVQDLQERRERLQESRSRTRGSR
ncbi:MAG: FtsH protease activity modulator HflK [Gammaproteobacteria bacterium]|nr:MAG: FtsH protease activity modulator HflK [Gammaproteobacteria bacterium]